MLRRGLSYPLQGMPVPQSGKLSATPFLCRRQRKTLCYDRSRCHTCARHQHPFQRSPMVAGPLPAGRYPALAGANTGGAYPATAREAPQKAASPKRVPGRQSAGTYTGAPLLQSAAPPAYRQVYHTHTAGSSLH